MLLSVNGRAQSYGVVPARWPRPRLRHQVPKVWACEPTEVVGLDRQRDTGSSLTVEHSEDGVTRRADLDARRLLDRLGVRGGGPVGNDLALPPTQGANAPRPGHAKALPERSKAHHREECQHTGHDCV